MSIEQAVKPKGKGTHSMKHLGEKTKIILLYISCFIIIAASITAVILVYSYDYDKKSVETDDNTYGYTSDYVLDPTSDLPFEFWYGITASEEDAEPSEAATENEETEETEDNELPEQTELTLELIYQYPELPAGCESVALTMLLNYYGFNLDKTTIADDYLIYSNDSFVTGFLGNPYTSTGGGAYAPAMTDTANLFLAEQGSDLSAINISGTDFDDLLYFVADGTPVMVWTTMYLSTPEYSGTIHSYDDTDYQWVTSEHCVVLSGYNLTTNEVTIYDSISGIVTYDKDDFAAVYDGMWKMAMILQ
jgi:uncharacterized protein YvpB